MINRRNFIRGTAATTLAAVAGTSLFACAADTHGLETNTVRLPVGLSTPLRLVALGDIHFDPLFEEAYLQEVANRVAALKPDIVVLTGDFTTNNPSQMDIVARILGRIESRMGTVTVLGNHDVWMGSESIERPLRENGIRILRNAFMEIPGEKNFFLTGLDTYWAGKPDPSIIERTPANSRHILLVHEPDPFPQLNDSRIKLQISGHTHGGQVRIPLIGAVVLPKWGKKYQQGLFELDNRYLYVNRGVGTLMPHIRVDCRPEITVFELT